MTTSETNRTTVIARLKRAADSNRDEADSSDLSLEEVMTEEESKFRDGLDNSMMGNEETEEEEVPKEDDEEDTEEEEEDTEEVPKEDDEEDTEEEEEDTEEEEFQEEDEHEVEGGERQKRALRGWRRRKKIARRSLGLYGLFQLSDSYFCSSGYRWSKNKCNTSCAAFSDDNIEDDIECLVKTHYWWILLKRASRRCRYRSYNYLSTCN
nr:PREDICTED: nucleolin-like [Paralichthys olivaceus]